MWSSPFEAGQFQPTGPETAVQANEIASVPIVPGSAKPVQGDRENCRRGTCQPGFLVAW